MEAYLVATAHFPIEDVNAAARAWVACGGGSLADRTVQLRRCRGIVVDNVSRDEASSVATALSQAGCRAWALPGAAIPVLPRPLTAHSLDFRDPEHLKAQVRFTGPPELVAWNHIAAVVPAHWQTSQRTQDRAVQQRQNIGAAALDFATTGGIGTLMRARNANKQPGSWSETVQSDDMVEIVALAPLRRIQVFASRMDYAPLLERGVQGSDNWKLLLDALCARTRPDAVGRAYLEAALRGEELPASLHVSDQHDLGRTTRWMLILATLRRMAERRAEGN